MFELLEYNAPAQKYPYSQVKTESKGDYRDY